jgi:transketolase
VEPHGSSHRSHRCPAHVDRTPVSPLGRGVATCTTARTAWDETLCAYRERQPARAAELERTIAGQLPPGWLDALPSWTGGTSVSGRDAWA